MNEIPDYIRNYIEQLKANRLDAAIQAQGHILNWLFAMNTAGLGGVLAFAATKGGGWEIFWPVMCFSVGILCLIGYSAMMFYWEKGMYLEVRTDSSKVMSGEMKWEDFIQKESDRSESNLICEILAWLAGISGLTGVVLGTLAIL